MARESIFAGEWRACLREHYKYVVRQDDESTRRTLAAVLHSVGFSEDELARLGVEATMRADDMPDDYVPDMDILQQDADDRGFQPHPAEGTCPACMAIDESQFDEDGQPIDPDPEAADHEPGSVVAMPDEDEDDADDPQQLTLF